MSFIQRELDRINGALLDPANADVYDRLYAAQQALAWAAEPTGFRSPYASVMGIQEGSEGCSAHPHPEPSSGTRSRSEIQPPLRDAAERRAEDVARDYFAQRQDTKSTPAPAPETPNLQGLPQGESQPGARQPEGDI